MQLRKKAALKKLYSAIVLLAAENDQHEFTNLILMAKKFFVKYGINQLDELTKDKIVDLTKYKEEKERL